MPQQVIQNVSAVAIGEFETDRQILHDVFQKYGWRLLEAGDRCDALRLLEQNPVHVVIAQSELPSWGWKKILSDLRRLAQPPQLIVTSRTADDYLWAEVLNIGGYDVLPQPLERDEVERVVAAACRSHHIPAGRSTAYGTVAPAAIVA
jgi:DNA-binding response OmpR family regulator